MTTAKHAIGALALTAIVAVLIAAAILAALPSGA
jgi:hypothetical protein